MKMRELLSATALAGVLVSLPAVASAQTKPTPAAADKEEEPVVTVTGSRIGRAALDSPAPITSVTADDLFDRGQINVGDALNDLPQLRSTFSQANSTRFIGTSGLSILDLRGLGTARTLVLVNGRRHVTSVPGAYSIDTNTIPPELLERVDIVTGGNSAVYGSDAVAGVVNFVLKKNFDGLRISGQGGASYLGDRGSYFGAITYGRNFAEGRGNIAVSGEYSRLNPLYFTDRPDQTGAFDGRSQFNLAENTVGEPAAGNGIADNQFFTNVRNGTISDGGILNATCTAADLALSNTTGNRFRCRASGFGQRYAFDSTGNLILSNPALDFRDITAGASNNTVGGLGSTLRNTGQLNPLNERYSGNILAHYDFSDLFKVFFEGKYVGYNVNQEGQPSFFQGSIPAFFGAGNNLRCNNPFLNAQALSTLQAIGQCANVATSTFNISRFNVDFGGRGELQKRELYRVVGGLQGDFNGNWHYELALNYGSYSSSLRSLNNLVTGNLAGNPDGFLLALDAVAAPANFTGTNFATGAAGQRVVCAVNAVTNTRPDCVPINVFGFGAPSQAALNFVNTTATRQERATEFDVTFNLTGDLGKLFQLPGGPVRFNIGAEYRRETARAAFDALTAAGGTFLNAIQPFNPPALTVTEGYGEVEIPLLKNVPFFEELTVTGAGRYSSYNNTTGGVWSYNAGVVWAPIRDLRFRGTYAQAVRAPTQSDLFSPQSQNFAFVADPCDVLNINNGQPTRPANCAAAGVPVGFANTVFRSQTAGFLQGGNPLLVAETSKSFTFGFVAEPRFARGFSLTVDYYNIEVTNLIATLGLQTILNLCYDQANLNNQFCALLNPRLPGGLFPNSVGVTGGVNFAKQRTSGIDVDATYRKKWDSGASLQLRALVTYLFERTNFTNPQNAAFGTAQLGNVGDPRLEGQFTANFNTGSGFGIRYQLQYIGVQSIGAFEAQHPFQGRPPTNLDQFPQVNYPAVTYHNFRLSQAVNKKFEFYFGVDNAFNQLPPLGALGTGGGDAIFTNFGRYFYSGFKVTLGSNGK